MLPIDNDGNTIDTETYTYDGDNLIKFTYTEANEVTEDFEFIYENGLITEVRNNYLAELNSINRYFYNDNNVLLRVEEYEADGTTLTYTSTYTYDNGNIIVRDDNGATVSYTFDSKKDPFTLLFNNENIYAFFEINQNNILTRTFGNNVATFEYTYNEEGYPTEEITTGERRTYTYSEIEL